jgi:hypothetical protein
VRALFNQIFRRKFEQLRKEFAFGGNLVITGNEMLAIRAELGPIGLRDEQY